MGNLYQTIVTKTPLIYLKKLKSRFLPNKRERKLIEEEKAAIIRRQEFYSKLLNPGELCFDVGANIGNRILPLLNIGAKVIAVEPQRSCIRILKKKFGNKITIVPKGLSNKEGIMDFYISDSTTVSSFSKEWIQSVKNNRFKGYTWKKVVKTEMTTLDILIKQFGTPKFVKVDVEGFEFEVLSGLSMPVKYLSFEYTVPEQLDKVKQCIARLEEIDSNIEFNYSIGESMNFALNNWISLDEIKNHLQTNDFINTNFGDIYIRNKNL